MHEAVTKVPDGLEYHTLAIWPREIFKIRVIVLFVIMEQYVIVLRIIVDVATLNITYTCRHGLTYAKMIRSVLRCGSCIFVLNITSL